MPTSDEDVQKKQEQLKKLRQQVTQADGTRVQRERELANDVTMRQLEAEEAALRARLAVAKDQGKVANVKAGAAAPLDAVTSEMERAVAQQKAAESGGQESARVTESTTSGRSGGEEAAKGAGSATTAKES